MSCKQASSENNFSLVLVDIAVYKIVLESSVVYTVFVVDCYRKSLCKKLFTLIISSFKKHFKTIHHQDIANLLLRRTFFLIRCVPRRFYVGVHFSKQGRTTSVSVKLL